MANRSLATFDTDNNDVIMFLICFLNFSQFTSGQVPIWRQNLWRWRCISWLHCQHWSKSNQIKSFFIFSKGYITQLNYIRIEHIVNSCKWYYMITIMHSHNWQQHTYTGVNITILITIIPSSCGWLGGLVPFEGSGFWYLDVIRLIV